MFPTQEHFGDDDKADEDQGGGALLMTLVADVMLRPVGDLPGPNQPRHFVPSHHCHPDDRQHQHHHQDHQNK